MSPATQRALGAVGAVAVSAAVNLATGWFTAERTVAWWASGVALLVVGTAIQFRLPVAAADPARTQEVAGAKVRGALSQRMAGSGTQTVRDTTVGHDLNQSQG